MSDFNYKSEWILPSFANTSAWKDYEAGAVLGKGTFGTTYAATDRGTKEKVAIKVIPKKKLVKKEEIEDVHREVQILFQLRGHPNVVQLKGKGVYEDKQNVCIVMEQCTGGELFDAIVKKGHYSEKDAAALIRTIVVVIAHCHAMNVMHRDLKPENFLLSDTSKDALLKVTDFGLSCFFKENEMFSDMVGSPFYLAPEVLRKRYSKEADIWSCGVMLYILLCGFPPFHGAGEKQIFESVLRAPLDFQSAPWPKISASAKDCVKRMLVRDPSKRATAAEILKHEWMRENGVASEEPLELEVLSRINNFATGNRLKKEALKSLVNHLDPEELEGLKAMFKDIDKDCSGTISTEEFVSAIHRKGSHMTEDELVTVMKKMDVNGDGCIDYSEFVAAMLNTAQITRIEALRKAFDEMDADKNGSLDMSELRTILKDAQIKDIDEIMKQVDSNGDGVIDFSEFVAMFA